MQHFFSLHVSRSLTTKWRYEQLKRVSFDDNLCQPYGRRSPPLSSFTAEIAVEKKRE